MRYLCFLCFTLFNHNSNAQKITLVNSWQKNSFNLYIGVENLLHLQGDINEIAFFSGDIQSITNRKDSLLFHSIEPGNTIIKVHFKNGSIQTFLYNTLYLPPPMLHFTKGAETYENLISMQDILTVLH